MYERKISILIEQCCVPQKIILHISNPSFFFYLFNVISDNLNILKLFSKKKKHTTYIIFYWEILFVCTLLVRGYIFYVQKTFSVYNRTKTTKNFVEGTFSRQKILFVIVAIKEFKK